MANPIAKAPWKIPFDVNGSGPYAVKVKLSDLLFDKTRDSDGHKLPEGQIAPPKDWIPWNDGGFRLPHDIILYDPAIYGTDGALTPSAPQERRQTRGFFLTKVSYDARAASTTVLNPFYKNLTAGNTSTAGYVLHDSKAALTPRDELEYRRRDLTYNMYLPPEGSDYYANQDYYASSCTVAVEGSQQEAQSFLILTNRDDALEATIPGSSVIPYTRIRANANPSIQEVYDIVRFFTGYGVGDTGDRSIKSVPGQPDISSIDTLNPLQNVFLQHVEIWLRCSFFADYVDPKSYDQDLHNQSDVRHRNLILGTGDFERFTTEASATETRPYLPLTPPRADILTAKLQQYGATASFPIPSKAGESDAAINQANAPIGWFDPDFETPNDSTAVAVPPEGNIYTSGRIFSPTIDELWVYIKKAVSGRNSDSMPITSATPRSTASQQAIATDTRLDAEPDFLIGSKLGDPLSSNGADFVNAGEGIQYFLNTGIRRAADAIFPGIHTSKYSPFATDTTGDTTRAAIASLQSTGRWALRDHPFSLRELEAAIKNEAFNAEIVFNYLTTNMVPSGHVEANKDGTLYRLHRAFNASLSVSDNNSRWNEASATALVVETIYGDALPGAVDSYNHTIDIDKSDVYLSAEGKWRYVFDHVRVPVLNEQY